MINHPLAVMVFASGNDRSDITRLNSIITMVNHKLERPVKSALIVCGRCRGLMMHDDLHPFLLRIALQFLHIKVGVRRYEIKHLFLIVPKPILPADVPAFYEHAIKAMLSGKIKALLNGLGCCPMSTIRFKL